MPKQAGHLWAENYDRKLDDIFSVQDEICKNIMVALQVKLTVGEMARMGADTVNIKAYEKYLKAQEHHLRRTKEDSLVARQLFQEAIALDPEYAMAYLEVGWTYLDEVWFGMTKTPSESIAKAEEMVQKAISIHGLTSRRKCPAKQYPSAEKGLGQSDCLWRESRRTEAELCRS